MQFHHDGRSPRASINHVTVHDGFTLADLVSYGDKHNEANGEDNRDGSDDNLSLNCGVEGADRRSERYPGAAPPQRAQSARLPVSRAGRSAVARRRRGRQQPERQQQCLCQDNETGWVDWSKLGNDDDLSDFVGTLTKLRREFAQIAATPLA